MSRHSKGPRRDVILDFQTWLRSQSLSWIQGILTIAWEGSTDLRHVHDRCSLGDKLACVSNQAWRVAWTAVALYCYCLIYSHSSSMIYLSPLLEQKAINVLSLRQVQRSPL